MKEEEIPDIVIVSFDMGNAIIERCEEETAAAVG